MRMWMVEPSKLCRKHLLGEHVEIHKHKHCFVKKYSISKRISPVVQIEPSAMQTRHDELAQEMIRRGYKHQSVYEMPDISHLPLFERMAKVDISFSIQDLSNRCVECRQNLNVGSFQPLEPKECPPRIGLAVR